MSITCPLPPASHRGAVAWVEPPPDAAARAAQLSAQRAVQAEQEGYDAFCPFGTLDIGVREARTCVQIPVVGQAEACFLFCGLTGPPVRQLLLYARQ